MKKPIRERKELAVGTTSKSAIANFNETGKQFDEAKHEIVYDSGTTLFSIYHRRKPNDRSCKRPISRVASAPYSNARNGRDRRPVVVTLLPRELIETRLKGTRRRYSICWDDLHAYLVRRHALHVLRLKQIERASKRKEKKGR